MGEYGDFDPESILLQLLAIMAILNERLDQLESRLEAIMTKKIEELEKKFDDMKREIPAS